MLKIKVHCRKALQKLPKVVILTILSYFKWNIFKYKSHNNPVLKSKNYDFIKTILQFFRC